MHLPINSFEYPACGQDSVICYQVNWSFHNKKNLKSKILTSLGFNQTVAFRLKCRWPEETFGLF